ncbi:MAG: hypothetical protein J7L69_02050 [Desulfobulbaceae bacterium]|nr:hypothetical protein [Desulfobulbaceae bacterium]
MFQNLRSRLGLVILVFIAVNTLSSPVLAEESKIDVDLDIPIVSKYVWRGMEINEDAVLQPSLTLASSGFSFNLWGNMDLTDFGEDECVYTSDCDSRAWQFTEIDLTIDYSHSFDKLTLGVGLIDYLYPNWDDAEDTQEVYLATSYDVLFQPSFTLYYDFNEVNGFYANFAIGYSFSINDRLDIDLSSSIGYADSDYNSASFGSDDSAFVDFNIGVEVPFRATDTIAIIPMLTVTTLLDSDIRDSIEDNAYGNDDTYVYGGVNVSFSF